MNIFALHTDPMQAAHWHNDKHCVKMILESAQMLSTAIRETSDFDPKYKSTHVNHPCSKWVRATKENYTWLLFLSSYLNDEYRYRYDKNCNHKSYDVILELPGVSDVDIPNGSLTSFEQAMPNKYKRECSIDAYRAYYIGEKRHIASWKKRNVPSWFI